MLALPIFPGTRPPSIFGERGERGAPRSEFEITIPAGGRYTYTKTCGRLSDPSGWQGSVGNEPLRK